MANWCNVRLVVAGAKAHVEKFAQQARAHGRDSLRGDQPTGEGEAAQTNAGSLWHGATVKDGQIEIRGDKRAEVARILTDAGFRSVFAGG